MNPFVYIRHSTIFYMRSELKLFLVPKQQNFKKIKLLFGQKKLKNALKFP